MHTGEKESGFSGYGIYVVVWAVLLALTGTAVATSGAFAGLANIAAPLVIAAVKASLVVYFFMHLKDERGIIRVVILIGLVTIAILFALLFSDVGYR